MRKLKGPAAVALLLLMGAALMGAESPTVFPAIEGKALNGETFEAPKDFGRTHNLVIAAFLREQQADVDTWIPGLEQLERANPAFAFYEFPVLPEMNAVSRWWIYQGMRSGIRSESARARTVTFHIDKAEFRSRLAIENENTIHLFLVDRKGNILWRATGPWSPDKEDSLTQRLAQGETGKMEGEMTMEAPVRFVRTGSLTAARFSAFGPIPEPEAFKQLDRWGTPKGLLKDPSEFLLLGRNNPPPPPEGGDYGYEYLLTIGADVDTKGIEVVELAPAEYAVIRASFTNITARWDWLYRWAEAEGYSVTGHGFEEHLTVPDKFATDDMLFDLWLPVEK